MSKIESGGLKSSSTPYLFSNFVVTAFIGSFLRVKTFIEPLAAAVNIAQGSRVRCDQVFLVLANLYRIYDQMITNDAEDPSDEASRTNDPVHSILNSIEKRWAKCDQDLYIACFVLNPSLNQKLLNANACPPAYLVGIVKRLYARVFSKEPDKPAICPPTLISSLLSYLDRKGLFHSSTWDIEELSPHCQDPVCICLTCSQFLRV
jgi:hypothetical protein